LHAQWWLEDPDGVLVARAQAGDRAAFEELVRRHSDRLCAMVRRLGLPRAAAEEVTQESFLRAWRGIDGFKGQARFFTWLYRIAVNETKRRLEREPARLLYAEVQGRSALSSPPSASWSGRLPGLAATTMR
jgi:RNA polymerase sigma-70 factor (ECF subfamily)